MPAALCDFRRRHQVRISLRVGAGGDLAGPVRERALDVAFLGLPTTAEPRGVAASELARARLVVAVAPDHRTTGSSASRS
ncbi:LysR substrate-binding domain-containing protein [Streptomyces sp. NPDC001797]|uniref:LysR substrate-binding domain-containing protein n=1 Tax=Streptomyces sp. NPDC001797 TaxID=3364610 RepID=UPI0036B794F0